MKIKKIISSNSDFLLLAALLVLVNYRIWTPGFWPSHDTFRFFQTFYIFYNDFFLHHELVRWLPYGVYGIPADFFQINGLSPADYFVGFAGWIFRVKDVLSLFWISILLQQFILLLGTYLLSRELFDEKASVFFVSLGMFASTVWVNKILFNFHSFYMLPLIFYFLFLFFKREKINYLWLAGITFVVSMFGASIFMVTLHALICLIFFVILIFCCGFPETLRQDKYSLLLGVLFFLTAFLYLYFQIHMFDGVHADRPFRDPETNTVPLDIFLSYQGQTDFKKFLMLFFAGQTDTFSLYVGLLPLIFFVYAIINVKNRFFTGIGILAAFIVLFSISDVSFVARTSYHLFPPLHYYRYIGHVGAIFRLLILLGCGFGLDEFLKNIQKEKEGPAEARKSLLQSGIAVLGLMALLYYINIKRNWTAIASPEFSLFSWIVAFAAILMLTGRAQLSHRGAFIAFFLTIDLFSFQNLIYSSAENLVTVDYRVPTLSRYEFQPERRFAAAQTSRAGSALASIDQSTDRETSLMYPFAQFDPCVPADWTPYWSNGIFDLSTIRAGNPPHMPSQSLPSFAQVASSNPDLKQFLNALGCEAPKLRLTSNVVIAKDREEARRLASEVSIGEQVVLFSPQNLIEYSPDNPDFSLLGNINIRKFSFSELVLEVTVSKEGGAFLYYADSFDEGWEATLNGQKTPIFEANLAFKALFIPKGTHTLKLSYFDGLSGIASYGLTLVGILFMIGVFFGAWKMMYNTASSKGVS